MHLKRTPAPQHLPDFHGLLEPRAVSAQSVRCYAESRQLLRRVPNLYELARLKPITSPARIWQPPCFMTPQNPD